MAPAVLGGVVALGVLGRVEVPPARPSASALVPASSAAVVAAAPTPSHRSDWPAAIRRPDASPDAPRRAREEGTDGLMGGIPFGLPNDNPYPKPELVNRFTIDDAVVLSWSFGPSLPTKVHRVRALPSYTTDPRAR